VKIVGVYQAESGYSTVSLFVSLDEAQALFLAEGEIDSVDEMVEVCRTGPRHAQIKQVNVKEAKFQDFKEFKIIN